MNDCRSLQIPNSSNAVSSRGASLREQLRTLPAALLARTATKASARRVGGWTVGVPVTN